MDTSVGQDSDNYHGSSTVLQCLYHAPVSMETFNRSQFDHARAIITDFNHQIENCHPSQYSVNQL